MRKTALLMAVAAIVGLAAGCAADKSAMWRAGGWNPEKVKWAAETHLDGDVPRTTIQTKPGATLIFQ